MMKFFKGKIFKFIVIPIVAIVLIFFAVDLYQKNRITEKDKAYVEWHDEHYEKLEEITEPLESMEDDYNEYVDQTPSAEIDGHAFLQLEADKYPELYSLYNKPEFTNLTQEAIDHPYPDNKLLREAHASYVKGNKELQNYAIDLIDGIGENDTQATYRTESNVYSSYLITSYFKIREVEKDHDELD